MSCSFLPPSPCSIVSPPVTKQLSSKRRTLLPVTCSTKYRQRPSLLGHNKQVLSGLFQKPVASSLNKPSSLLQLGALLTTIIEQPAFAVTGNNNYEEDLSWVLIQSGIVAVWYFLVMPPVVMNWLRLRWYKRKFLEMYLQFMCVFLFFPGILLWAPFLNFRRFPRDPTMKYPWSTPQDASMDNP